MKLFLWSIPLAFGLCNILSIISSASTPTLIPQPTATVPRKIFATPVASLNEVPIYVGEMTFNEMNNRGFSQQYMVSWSSQDLVLTTDGQIFGTFTTTYEGPKVSYPEFRDVLFTQVQARYIYPIYGDIAHEPLSEVFPLVAEQSSEQSATFVLNGGFDPPPLVIDVDGGLPLRQLEVTLTWVRVYKSEQGLYVHVFAGDAERDGDKPSLDFNQEAHPIMARFGYYAVLSEEEIKGGDFDYYTWIQKNIQW